ncbi:unnamed protein product [Urochloa humidicola]
MAYLVPPELAPLQVGFAAQLKPNVFDGTNYKRWVGRLELWLKAISVWFITYEHLVEPHTVDEDRAYLAADTLFRRAAIMFFERTLSIHTCSTLLASCCGMHSRQTLGYPMQAVNSTSWNSSMTTRWSMTVLSLNRPMSYRCLQRTI